MQFAFGSKVMKPLSTKTGISSAAGDVRGRVQGGAVADAANTRARQRRSVCTSGAVSLSVLHLDNACRRTCE